MNHRNKKLKKFLIITIILSSLSMLLPLSNISINRIKNSISLRKYSETTFSDEDIYIAISSKTPQVNYIPQNKNKFASWCKELDYDYCINGSYFNASFEHSGLLIQNSKEITPISLHDKQLTHIVKIEKDKISFIEKTIYAKRKEDTAIQTGPLIVLNNEIQSKFIDKSLNGNGAYKRTLLGYTKSGKYLLIITRIPMTLRDTANTLLKHPLLKNETISVINLDGGPSTAMYSKKDGIIIAPETQNLPILIGL